MSKPITYIIREKTHHMILFELKDQMDRKLSPQEVYADFDEKVMEMGWTEAKLLPFSFDISTSGEIIERKEATPTPIVEEAPASAVTETNDQEATLDVAALVESGTISLGSNQKIVENRIVEKSLEEQIAAGLIELSPNQKVENGEIVPKTKADFLKEELISLNEPFEYLDGEQIAVRSVADALEQGLIQTKVQAEEGLRLIRESIESEIAKLYSTSQELKLTKDYMAWITDGQPAQDKRATAYQDMQEKIKTVKQNYEATKEALKKLT